MRAELANLNHCAVPFLSRVAVNLSWYDITLLLLAESNNFGLFYHLKIVSFYP